MNIKKLQKGLSVMKALYYIEFEVIFIAQLFFYELPF
jgi:hypothetical protein